MKGSFFLSGLDSRATLLGLAALGVAMPLSTAPLSFAQATSVNGAIQGTITDSAGAVVSGAAVAITNTGTQQVKRLVTDGSGFYSSGPLIPGNYQVAVHASGFGDLNATTIVQIGTTTSGNYKVAVSTTNQTVEVNSGEVQIDPSQSNVQNVITAKQIESLPINGRNFLDLAQLEPGVQLQSGGTFDPTKQGYSALSFSGSSGRTTRILLDGQDITDETVGTTIFNVSEGAIGQFQIVRSTSDVSNDIGSTGQVLVSTNSGSNAFHGNVFYNFQDARAGISSANGIDPPFQRNQFGGSVGGPILKDKLFFFANAERIKQDGDSSSQVSAPFTSIQTQFPEIPAPYRETYSTARLDWSGPWNVHYFARANYNVNSIVTNGGTGYQNYANRDNTPGIAYGADFSTGRFTHSLRGSYEKFHNLITDASGSGVYNSSPIAFRDIAAHLYSGANANAPQVTYQSDKQLRYDGSWTRGSHNLRYGASLNRILGGGFASFFGLSPRATFTTSSLVAGLDPGDPLNYAPNTVTLGNGLGYYTETPEFGAPAGGQGDWRVGAYIADTWKITPQFTANYGLRYQRDTGRTDSDLTPIPCSEIDPSYTSPCSSGSSAILDAFGAGLGAKVRQPNTNFGPQLGFAYALGSDAKTVIRSSIGIFFENSVFNNVLFDRPAKLKTGLFNNYFSICGGTNSFNLPGQSAPVTSYNGTSIQALCAEPLSQSGAAFAGLQQELQSASAAAGPAANASYLGQTLTEGNGYFAFAPDYKTPYSTQVNAGVQRQLSNGAVLSIDYVHQNAVHIGQTRDVNHVGAARYLNTANAHAAVTATLAKLGYANVNEAIAAGATISDFSSNGLDSGVVYNGGYSPQYNPGSAAGSGGPVAAAFPGANPLLGLGDFQFPAGRSGYDALQMNYREQKAHPMRGISDSNLEISYAYSRFVTNIGGATNSDAYFAGGTWDNDNPTQYVGYGNLDHRHNFSFGGSVTIAHGPQVSLIGHLLSAPPTNLTLDNTPGATAQIFQTDVTGDGTTGDLLQGTNPGAYMRNIDGHSLNRVITSYNTQHANQPTPAGQALIDNGIFNLAQLQALGAVQQPIAAAPSTALQNSMFRQVDASISYPIRLPWLGEAARLQPGIAAYNVANFGNYNGPTGNLINVSDAAGGGADNYVNGSNNYAIKNGNRVLRQSGTFDSGAGRSLEYQLKLSF